jgi:ABC-2 type transport system ATP-binding protein
MIEIKNLTKKIGNNVILDDVNLTVQEGEILGFLGPNGAGKTTTMKILTSFWTPSSGEVNVDEVNVVRDSLATRKKIGYLPENVPLYDDMKVYEYLRFVAEMRGLREEDVKTRIKDVVKDCGLEKVIYKSIDELSKGYRQRVGLAQAIIHEPDILILDEPTTGLDPNQIVEIRELIKKIGQEKTVIFSTHILSEVSATCDRAVIINNGKIIAEGTPSELMNKAGGTEIIYAKIKGDKNSVMQKIKGLEGVDSVVEKDSEADNIWGYEIKQKGGVDVREKLSQLVMNSGWSIFEFSKKTVSLEDVFRELTK